MVHRAGHDSTIVAEESIKQSMGDRDLRMVEEDDPNILYRDRPYTRSSTLIRGLTDL